MSAEEIATGSRPAETFSAAVEGTAAPAAQLTLLAKLRRVSADSLIVDVVALAVLLLAFLGVPVVVVVIGSLLVFGLTLLTSRRAVSPYTRAIYPVGAYRVSRFASLVAFGVTFVAPHQRIGWVPLLALAMTLAAEGSYARLARLAVPWGVRLPGLSLRNDQKLSPRWVFYVNIAAVAVLGIFAGLRVPVLAWFLVALIAVAVTGAGLLDCVLLIRGRVRAEHRVTHLLNAYAPLFAVHFDAEGGTGYQVGRWLPYLDRLGERYVVIVRNLGSLAEVTAMTDQPVLLRRARQELDAVMVRSLKAVFYVNNAIKNAHSVRYPEVKHIQLNHGDSDKQPSYSSVFRMFDKNFVAGQAAVDRFSAHGVVTAPGFFEIVGRPQVEDVQLAAPRQPDDPPVRVLYAPTWAGMHLDSAYSSLPIGVAIVEGLIAHQCAVIFRPHPYTARNPELAVESMEIQSILAADAEATGRRHVWGGRAEQDWTITDCFNAADALISDISSVPHDFLYSEKPFAVCAMSGTLAEFHAEMPIARAGYVIRSDGSNISEVVADMLDSDPRRAIRRQLKTHYLGNFPAEGYANAFVDAARRMLS